MGSRSGFKTLRVRGDALVALLSHLSMGEARAVEEFVPPGAALVGVESDGRDLVLKMFHHRWPVEIAERADFEDFVYVFRPSVHNAWGAPTGLS